MPELAQVNKNTPPKPYKSWAAYYASLAKETTPATNVQTQEEGMAQSGLPTVDLEGLADSAVNKEPTTPTTPIHNGNVEGTTTDETQQNYTSQAATESQEARDEYMNNYGEAYEAGTATDSRTGLNIDGEAKAQTETAEAGSFGAWYKTNYGEDYTGQEFLKSDDMSATEYAIGQNLYYTEQAETSLKEDYDNNLKEIAASQSKDEQESYILYEKLKRYLGMSSAAQGKGVDSGDMIAANSNYQNALSGIGESYSGMKTDLTSSYNTNKLDNSQQSQDQLTQLYAQQEAATEADTAVTEAEDTQTAAYVGQAAYSHLQGLLEAFEVDDDGNISYEDYQSLQEYYEKYKSQMDSGTRTQIEMMLDDDVQHAEEGELVTETDYANFLDGNTTLKYEDVDYVITTDGLKVKRPGGDVYADYENGDVIVDEDLYRDSDYKTNPNARTYVFYDGYFYEINKK